MFLFSLRKNVSVSFSLRTNVFLESPPQCRAAGHFGIRLQLRVRELERSAVPEHRGVDDVAWEESDPTFSKYIQIRTKVVSFFFCTCSPLSAVAAPPKFGRIFQFGTIPKLDSQLKKSGAQYANLVD